jgi:hypothetical protein
MTKEFSYATFVAQAEDAVKSLKDPELKKIAFQKVLEDLMGAGDRPSSSTKKPPARKPAKTEKPRAAKGGTTAYVRELVEDSFFGKPKTLSDVKIELENRGHHIPLTSLSGRLQSLCQARKLRRNKNGAKNTFVYSNW